MTSKIELDNRKEIASEKRGRPISKGAEALISRIKKEDGFDTIDANLRLGFEADERIFEPAAEMLRQLGYRRIRLMTNNPDKVAGLEAAGIEVVERVQHHFPSNVHNELYLETKRRRSGHLS